MPKRCWSIRAAGISTSLQVLSGQSGLIYEASAPLSTGERLRWCVSVNINLPGLFGGLLRRRYFAGWIARGALRL